MSRIVKHRSVITMTFVLLNYGACSLHCTGYISRVGGCVFSTARLTVYYTGSADLYHKINNKSNNSTWAEKAAYTAQCRDVQERWELSTHDGIN